MTEAKQKEANERRARIEQESQTAHEARVEHDIRALSRVRKVQINLRVWPDERETLTAKAKASGASFNNFCANVLVNGAEQVDFLTARRVLDDAVLKFQPLVEEAHAVSVGNDYRRAVGNLLALLKPLMDSLPGSGRAGINDATREIASCERVLDAEAATRMKRLRTTGAAG
jgi:uncharacterized protein (DUF1778 family)